jgi:hypothetical protein
VTKHGPRQPGQIQLASSGQIMLGKVSWALKYPYVDQQKASLISAAKNNCQAAVPTNCCSHVGAQTVTRRSQLSHCCSHVGAQTVAHTLLTTVTLLLTRRCANCCSHVAHNCHTVAHTSVRRRDAPWDSAASAQKGRRGA